jgi:protein transport protein SEC61 subunit gamma and related proteins
MEGTIKNKGSALLKEYVRVLKLTKKPSMIEYKTVVKVSALGIGIIGTLGFIIYLIKQTLF